MVHTLLEFFASEATEYLDQLAELLAAEGTPDADRLRRLGRALRGSARIANQEAIAEAAGAVQALATEVATGQRRWGPELSEKIEAALAEIRQMVEGVHAPPVDMGKRAQALVERLGPTPPPARPKEDGEGLRRYLGNELRALASEIGEALGILERDPRDREPLKKLLRRIRPLRGIKGVDEIPAVGTAVVALEEVILRIADTSATVGPGHLVLFRRAQRALEEVVAELARGAEPAVAPSAKAEIEDLKDRVLETAAQRKITWITQLFYEDSGPHIEECPMAERGAGSWEAFYTLETTGSLDTVDRLRLEMARDADGARQLGKQLAYTFRQMRERAVTFGHADLGTVARRAAAVVRAALDEPPWRLQAIAVDLAPTVTALRSCLEASGTGERLQALRRAEEFLEVAARRSKEPPVPIESLTYSAKDALARAVALRDEVSQILQMEQPDLARAYRLLDEILGLVEHALDRSGTA